MRGHVGTIDHVIRLVSADHLFRLNWALRSPFDLLRGVGTVSSALRCSLFISPLSKSFEESRGTDRRSMDYY